MNLIKQILQLNEDKDTEASLKKEVMRLKQEAHDKGIYRMDALDLSGIDKKYHDIVIHGVVSGTNTKRWRDFFSK